MLDNIDSLKHECRSSFKNFLPLASEDFEILGNKLSPKVSMQDTDCRNVIPLNELTTRLITYRLLRDGIRVYSCKICQGADCDTDHYPVIAEVRERLAVSKQESQKFYVEIFNVRKLK